MLACLSPNGRADYPATGPVTRLLVGTIKGVHALERTGRGEPWRASDSSLPGKQVNALVLEPRSGLIFAGIAGHGLYASADQGRTWELRSAGLRIDHIFAMAVDERSAPPVLYAGTLPPALFRSDDLGLTWRELTSLNDIPDADKWNFRAPPGAPHVKNIAFHPSQPNTFFVCIEQGGLMKTSDGGQTWTELFPWRSDDTFYRDAHRLAVQRSNPDVLYLASGDGLCKSVDGGRSWERLTTGTYKVGYPDALFIDPDDDRVVYIGGAGGHPGTWDEQTARPASRAAPTAATAGRSCARACPARCAATSKRSAWCTAPATSRSTPARRWARCSPARTAAGAGSSSPPCRPSPRPATTASS
jgi:photosystem II stability/assembly factor-like uncharacterized protein